MQQAPVLRVILLLLASIVGAPVSAATLVAIVSERNAAEMAQVARAGLMALSNGNLNLLVDIMLVFICGLVVALVSAQRQMHAEVAAASEVLRKGRELTELPEGLRGQQAGEGMQPSDKSSMIRRRAN